MDAKVRVFNNLPRPSAAPSGLPNHWVFGVRYLAVSVLPNDMMLAVHPHSKPAFLLFADSPPISTLPTASAKAAAIVPPLLDIFIRGPAGLPSVGADQLPGSGKPIAPWTWSTDDPDVAAAIADRLRQHGVLEDLQRPSVCSEEERHVLDAVWSRCFDAARDAAMSVTGWSPAEAATASIMPGDDSKCHGCGLDGKSFSQKFMRCSACNKAFYHSKTCQREHWKRHKPTCLVNRSSPSQPEASSNTLAPLKSTAARASNYYNMVARKDPDTQALLRALKLDPASPASPDLPDPEGYLKPMRRLALTGQDSPENMELLFGPNWSADIGQHLGVTRLDIWLDPPRGSPSYAHHARLDDASLGRSPRPPTDAEQRSITTAKEMQEMIRRCVGAGRPPPKEIKATVLTAFVSDWIENARIYKIAVSTMDQGLPS